MRKSLLGEFKIEPRFGVKSLLTHVPVIDFRRIDHVLICIPPNSKEAARDFYVGKLRLKEISGEHPNGALWFVIGDAELHVREEDLEVGMSGRHPAF